MAYGRLEVYWPDGEVDTHLLETETVSVGRADGNTIALDTDSISRYHFSIVKQDDEITITDLESANGTFVDGVPLTSNAPYELGDVEEIQAGALRIIFFKVDDEPTVAMQASDDVTQRMEREDAHIRIALDQNKLDVWPAASASTELMLANTGKSTRVYSVRISGMRSEWLRLNRSEVELDPGETTYVLINIKPPRRPNTVPNTYELTIEVAPVDNPDLAILARMEATIHSYDGFGMAVIPQSEPGEALSVFLHNQGSGTLPIKLRAKDPQGILTFRLPDTPLMLQAGQRMRIDVEMNTTAPALIGSTTTHTVIIQAQAQNPSKFIAATSAKVAFPPRFPIWMVLSGIGLLLALLVIAMMLLMAIFQPSDPVITSISLPVERVMQGETVILSVEASDVESFDILLNQILVEEDASGDRDRFMINTAGLSGETTVTIIGRNGSKSTNAQTNLLITVPMTIETFTVEPQQLVRYVVGTLRIEWDVSSAEFVQIQGLSAFTNQLLQSSTQYAPSHVLEGISGIPGESLEITLHAEDAEGNVLEDTILIPLIDPQCTALEPIVVHEGPDDGYQQVGQIPQDATVIVTAQDAEAGWLRVQLPGDVRGWAMRDLLRCAETFNVSELRTEMTIPLLPTPTTIPSLTPTPLPSPTRTLIPSPTAQATVEAVVSPTEQAGGG